MADGDITLETSFTGAPTYSGPVAESGDVTLILGDTYTAADSDALEWGSETGAWPDLADAEITLGATVADQDFTLDGEVIVASGDGQLIRVEIDTETAATLSELHPGTGRFDVQAVLASGHSKTLVAGTITLRREHAST